VKKKHGTHIFKEGEKRQGPNNGTNGSNDVLLRRDGATCGKDSVEDIQR
jgi:hypothetical protein